MRARVYRQERIGGYGLDTTGAVMSGPLTVTTAPTANLHASTKQYVDSKLSNITATQFTTGTVPVGRMPAFTGDLTTVAGGTVTTLANSTVTAGTYTKVTVNAKGIVTVGTTLLEADIPGFDWAKITSGKPTTLAGYGITNLVPATGGTLTGDLVINTTPTAATHIANKAYVDSVAASVAGGINVGDTIIKTTETTPTGYLRCNGGELSQTTYAALYAVVGDNYSYAVRPGSGKPWKQQYNINSTQSDEITAWETYPKTLHTAISNSQAIVTKNRVYLLGGITTAAVATIYTAQVDSRGNIGDWSTAGNLPALVNRAQAVVTKNKVYLLGGWVAGAAVNTVYSCPIDSEGVLGTTWTTETKTLPGPLADSQAVVTKNKVYLIGGFTTGTVTLTYVSDIDANGSLGTWSTVAISAPQRRCAQAIVTKSKVYLLGGMTASSFNNVYVSNIDANGSLGTFTAAPNNLYGVLAKSQAYVTEKRAYLVGGTTTAIDSVVYTAEVFADGTLGPWTLSTSLPGVLSDSQLIAVKDKLYMLGGIVSAKTNVIYVASINGGSSDYSLYYSGNVLATTTGNFRLPDYTLTDLPGTITYIKH